MIVSTLFKEKKSLQKNAVIPQIPLSSWKKIIYKVLNLSGLLSEAFKGPLRHLCHAVGRKKFQRGYL